MIGHKLPQLRRNNRSQKLRVIGHNSSRGRFGIKSNI